MKKISKLKKLPLEDQKHIFELCEQFTYPKVCEILAQPRGQEGGLSLQTNPSALSRFYSHYGWLAGDTQLLQQFADVLKEHPTEDLLEAVTIRVGQKLFRALLKDEIPIVKLTTPIRAYQSLKRLSFQERVWRHKHRLIGGRPKPATPVPNDAEDLDDMEFLDYPDITAAIETTAFASPSSAVPPVSAPTSQEPVASTPDQSRNLAPEIAQKPSKNPRNFTNCTKLQSPAQTPSTHSESSVSQVPETSPATSVTSLTNPQPSPTIMENTPSTPASSRTATPSVPAHATTQPAPIGSIKTVQSNEPADPAETTDPNAPIEDLNSLLDPTIITDELTAQTMKDLLAEAAKFGNFQPAQMHLIAQEINKCARNFTSFTKSQSTAQPPVSNRAEQSQTNSTKQKQPK